MTKYLAAFLAFVLLAVFGYAQYERAERIAAGAKLVTAQRDALAKSLEQAEKDKQLLAAVSEERQKHLDKLTRENAAKQKALNEALKANSDWADARVPDSVWDALGFPSPERDAGQTGPRVDAGGPGAAADGSGQRGASPAR